MVKDNVKTGHLSIVSASSKCSEVDAPIATFLKSSNNLFFKGSYGKTRICFWTAFDVCYEELRKSFPAMDERFFIRKPIAMNDLVDRIDKIINS